MTLLDTLVQAVQAASSAGWSLDERKQAIAVRVHTASALARHRAYAELGAALVQDKSARRLAQRCAHRTDCSRNARNLPSPITNIAACR